MRCLITVSPFGQDYSKGIARLKELGVETDWDKSIDGCADGRIVGEKCKDYDLIIAGSENWNAEAISQCKNLKCLVRYGVGIDAVDAGALTKAGVAFANIPGANSKGVADHAICLMMTAGREIACMSENLHKGIVKNPLVPQTTSATIGVIGTGNIGRTVIRYLSGMDVKFVAYDAFPNEEFAKQYHVTYMSLEEVLATADIVTLHCPLIPETKGMINKKTLALMKKSAVLVNTSRGGVVNSADLAEALRTHQIRGAALDVFEDEGGAEPMGKIFRDLDNAIITPHVASNTFDTVDAMMGACVDVIENFIKGQPIRTLLNPDYTKNI